MKGRSEGEGRGVKGEDPERGRGVKGRSMAMKGREGAMRGEVGRKWRGGGGVHGTQPIYPFRHFRGDSVGSECVST